MIDKNYYIFIGVIIGFALACFMFWYSTKDNISCDYGGTSAPIEDCTPDYMGSCN